jgi:hypothetical protein
MGVKAMGEISYGMQNMYDEQASSRKKTKGSTYTTPVAVLTVGVVGAMMPTPMNLYVWGAGAAGLVLAKGLENKIA